MGQDDQLSRSELFVTNLAAGIAGTPAKTFLKEYGLRGGFQALAGFLGDGRDPERTDAVLKALDKVLEAETGALYETLVVKAREEIKKEARNELQQEIALLRQKRSMIDVLLGLAMGAIVGYAAALGIHRPFG